MKSIPLTETELNHIKETYTLELERLQKRTNEISGILQKIKEIAKEESQVAEEKTAKVVPTPRKNVSLKKEKEKQVSLPVKLEEKVKGKRGRPARPKESKPEPKVAAKKEVTLSKEVILAAPKGKRGRKPSVKAVIENKPKTVKQAKETIKVPVAKKAKKAAKENKAEAKPLKAKKTTLKVEKAAPKKRGRKPSDDSKKARWTALILEILTKKGKVLPSREIIGQIMKIQNIPATELPKTRSIITGSLSDLKLETKKIKSLSVAGQKGELYGLSQWFNELGQLTDPSKL